MPRLIDADALREVLEGEYNIARMYGKDTCCGLMAAIDVVDDAPTIDAKQMINNADVVLRAETLFSDSKLTNSAILDMVSGKYKLLHEGEDGSLVQKY